MEYFLLTIIIYLLLNKAINAANDNNDQSQQDMGQYFATMSSDCSNYATFSGYGLNLSVAVGGKLLSNGTTGRFQLDEILLFTNGSGGRAVSQTINSTSTNCVLTELNTFTCPVPVMTPSPDYGNIIMVPACLLLISGAEGSVTSAATNYYCMRFYLGANNELVPNSYLVPKFFYHKDPVFQSVAFKGRRGLHLNGEAVSLWLEQCPSGKVSMSKMALYNITRGGLPCKVDWVNSNSTSIYCTIEDGDPTHDQVVVQLGDTVVFTYLTPQPQQTSLVQQLLALIIVVPVAAFLSACITVIVCLVVKRRRSMRRKSRITDIDMVACPHVAPRFEDLPPNLRAEIEPLRLDENNISLGALIGSGFFGEVRRAIMVRENGATMLVAVKFFKNTGSVNDLCDFLREAVLMCHFKHPNVLECYGIYVSSYDNRVAIVVPYMEESDLRHFVINNKDEVGIADIANFALQIAEGMLYLSNLGFVHRDLAARNCLIDAAHVVKVSDFGMSRSIVDKDDYYQVDDLASRPLPVRWMAPESFRTGKFTIKTDVWSFGILLWELCTKGGFPFADLESYVVQQRVVDGYFLERTSDIPESLYEVMRRCWTYEPTERATFAELVTMLTNLKAKMPRADEANYLTLTRDDDYLLPGQIMPAGYQQQQNEEAISPPIQNGDINSSSVANSPPSNTNSATSNYYHGYATTYQRNGDLVEG